ncbi:MAG: helix-turn-helix transcriptional regulator [bacterium]|nr:helix-turn-helix transcriptional regulator [bacterium]
MIISNLAVLLAERGLKITKVSRDTKISRTTLTALCSGGEKVKGVQFDTLNTLCSYLNVQPDAILKHYPIDFTNIVIGEIVFSDCHDLMIAQTEICVYYKKGIRDIENYFVLNATIDCFHEFFYAASGEEEERYDVSISLSLCENGEFLPSAPLYVKNELREKIIGELKANKDIERTAGNDFSISYSLEDVLGR